MFLMKSMMYESVGNQDENVSEKSSHAKITRESEKHGEQGEKVSEKMSYAENARESKKSDKEEEKSMDEKKRSVSKSADEEEEKSTVAKKRFHTYASIVRKIGEKVKDMM